MSKTASEYLVEALEKTGVKRVYGVVGDSLNGFTDALRRRKSIDWIHMRHEEAAAFAAGAEAHLTGNLAVCAGSCGPGNLHLINGLFDCQRNGVPVLAIAAHIPSSEIGIDYFQATHPENLFRECSHYVELVSNPNQLPQILKRAIRVAIAKRGVAVVVLPGDVALMKIDADVPEWIAPTAPVLRPSEADIEQLAGFLNEASRVTLVLRRGMRRRSCRSHRTGPQTQGADRACLPRQGIRRIRQSLRRRDDRSRGLCVRLRGDEELRCAPDARYRFSIPGVLSGAGKNRAGGCAAGSAWQSLFASSRPARDRQGYAGGRFASGQGEDGLRPSQRCVDRLQESQESSRRAGGEWSEQRASSIRNMSPAW